MKLIVIASFKLIMGSIHPLIYYALKNNNDNGGYKDCVYGIVTWHDRFYLDQYAVLEIKEVQLIDNVEIYYLTSGDN